MLYIKQSTAYTPLIGPFLDDSDGNTAETGLYVTDINNRVQRDIMRIVNQGLREQVTNKELATRLFLKRGDWNKDWDRIATTESQWAMPCPLIDSFTVLSCIELPRLHPTVLFTASRTSSNQIYCAVRMWSIRSSFCSSRSSFLHNFHG